MLTVSPQKIRQTSKNVAPPVVYRAKKFFTFFKKVYLGGISKKAILLFTKNLSVMLKAGSTLPESLVVLAEQSRGKLQNILQEIYSQVNRGEKFSAVLKKYPKVFSDIYTNILQIGEESGTLEQNLAHLAAQLEKSYALRRKVVGALMYPAIVLIGGVGLFIGIAFFVLPRVTQLFSNFHADLPITTRVMVRLGAFLQDYGFVALGGLIALIIFLIWFLRREFIQPVTHRLFLKIPIIKSISRHVNLAVFCRTLSILLKSGITIDDGIQICTRSMSNIVYRNFLSQVYIKIKAGDSLNNVLKERTDLFPLMDIQIIGVGEESGTLSDSLNYCSSIHDDEIDDISRNLSSILEPLLLLLIGFMVGFLALSIISPIYSITNKLR